MSMVRAVAYQPPRPRAGPFRVGGFYGASVRSPGERKVVDTALTDSPFSTTGEVTLLNGVATGTDFTNRIGRRVNCVSVQVNGWIGDGGNAVNEVDSTMCRIMLVEDFQTNGVQATITDILSNADPTAFMNLNNRERFKVHFDKKFTVPPFNSNTTASDGLFCPVPTIKFFKKINVPVVFEGTAATIGSISSGALYLVVLGSQAATSLQLNWSARVRFVDA